MRFAEYLKTPHIEVKNQLFKKLCKASIMGDATSEVISMLFDPDVDIGDIADEMGVEIPRGGTAKWEKMRESARKEITKVSQEALKMRGLPDEFVVHRGGEIKSSYAKSLIPVSLDPQTAKDFATFGDWEAFRTNTPHKPINMFKVKRSSVVADVAAIRGRGKDFESEQELLVWAKDLKKL
jgi:hypothetical protein